MARASASAGRSRRWQACISDVVRIALAVVCAVPSLVFLRWYAWRSRRSTDVGGRALLILAIVGAALGAGAFHLERLALRVLGVSLDPEGGASQAAVLAMLLFVAPLWEALKLVPVWILYARHRIATIADCVSAALGSAAGFSAALAGFYVYGDATALGAVRTVLATFAHLFFSGVWGYALGTTGRAHAQWFTLAWLAATALHGLFAYIVFGRGPAMLAVIVPLLIAMATTSWSAFREFTERLPPSSRRLAMLGTLPQPPSFDEVRQALKRPNRPLFLHWIAIGGLVTLGTMMALFALAVYAGHRMGIDFGTTDEGDLKSSLPILLLGSALLLAFPLAAFLISRSASATSVLEPALSAALAIALLLLVLSMTAPAAIVTVLIVAPAAFALACAGAWFGLHKH
jgi:hypothetical protein